MFEKILKKYMQPIIKEAIVASTHRIHDVDEKIPDVRVKIVRYFDYKE